MFVWSKLSGAQWADAWEERFQGADALTAVITQVPGQKTVRGEVFCEKEADALNIQKSFGGSVRKVKMQNWAAMAPEPSEPFKVRDKLVICGVRSSAEIAKVAKKFPGRAIIAVPAELAFGTGHHATTATVLRFLVDQAEQWRREGRKWSLCDLGCGTGILGIAGAKLGAAKVWGCDFDPQAVRVAKENIERNQAQHCSFVKADVLEWEPRQQWDCVAANLFSDILGQAFPKIARAVKDDGIVMVSGILKTQAAECLAAGAKAGIKFERVVTKGKWVSAMGRK